MGKKKSQSIGIIYLIGMALVVIGFCIPMFYYGKNPFNSKLITQNGFDFINFDVSQWLSTGALLIFIGGCLGLVFELIFSFIKIKGLNKGVKVVIKLMCVLLSIAGGIILFIKFGDNSVTKSVGKNLLKYAFVGFYMTIVGWIVGIIGAITNK